MEKPNLHPPHQDQMPVVDDNMVQPTSPMLLNSPTSFGSASSTHSFTSTRNLAVPAPHPTVRAWYKRIVCSTTATKVVGALLKLECQQRLKTIDANKHVLHTYHDSFLYGEVPFCTKLRAALRTGSIGLLWCMLEFLFALLSGVLYVYSTYHLQEQDIYQWVSRIQNIASCVFVADYVLRIYCEPVRLLYIVSIWGLIDLLSAIPIVFLFKSELPGGSVLHLLQFLRIIRILSVFTDVGIVGSTLFQKSLLLAMKTMGAVFLSAGIMQWIESQVVSKDVKDMCPISGCLNFMDAFYYIIVTVGTVGYGDITPKTILGKIVTIIIIIGALIYIPLQVTRINVLASRRPYGGSFCSRKVIDSRYIIVSGSISYQAIQQCLAEFYNLSHCEDSLAYPLHVNILAPFQPSFELKKLLTLYDGLVEFIEGSPTHQADLERVCASKASAIFLLANKDTNDTKAEDAVQVVRALAVHRVCGNKVRIIVEVLEPTTQTSAVWDETRSGGIEIICPAKIHYKMLSRSCHIKGLYTFIANLFTSEIKLVNISESHFLAEFFHSFDNEVYPVIFPSAFHNMPFEEVAAIIFTTYNTVLFALDVSIVHKKRERIVNKVLLHPKGHIIRPDDVGLAIARNIHTTFAISNYGNKKSHGRFDRRRGKAFQPQYSHSQRSYIKTESVINRWKRTGTVTTLNFNRDSVVFDSVVPDGQDPARAFPVSPDGMYNLETQLRSAIQENVLAHKEDPRIKSEPIDLEAFPSWLSKHYGVSVDAGSSGDGGIAPPRRERGTQYPMNLSLEKATEKLLAWPPLSIYGQPHPTVLERRADVILEDLKRRTVSVVELKERHILLCCQGTWPHHLFYFIKGLRKTHGPNPPIVILHPRDLSAEQWGLVGIFKDVLFIKGSPIYELDLMRGGILQAEKVVIFANQGTPVDLTVQQVQDIRFQKKVKSTYTSDVDNVLVAANVERLVGEKPGFLLVEMQHTFAFDYLRPQFEISRGQVDQKDYNRNRDALVHFGPPFMEGRVVSSVLLGFLMRSTFYNRNTVSIVEQLVDGGYVEKDDCLGDNKYSRVLEQIPVPEQYGDRPYNDLFMGLLHEKGMLALGLYRSQGTLGSPTPYVFTNPPKDCIVNTTDIVYILV